MNISGSPKQSGYFLLQLLERTIAAQPSEAALLTYCALVRLHQLEVLIGSKGWMFPADLCRTMMVRLQVSDDPCHQLCGRILDDIGDHKTLCLPEEGILKTLQTLRERMLALDEADPNRARGLAVLVLIDERWRHRANRSVYESAAVKEMFKISADLLLYGLPA